MQPMQKLPIHRQIPQPMRPRQSQRIQRGRKHNRMPILGGKTMKPTVCVDFDGVLNNYRKYDENDLSTPREGAKEFLEELSKKYRVVILTARRFDKVMEWLNQYELSKYVFDVTNIKPPALAYIDDRGIPFMGDYTDTLRTLSYFEPYWKNMK